MRKSSISRSSAAVLAGAVIAATALAGSASAAVPVEKSRIAGPDRYATAVAISQTSHADGSEKLFIASGENFPDALAAGAAAGRLGAPVLLTKQASLPERVEQEIRRLNPAEIVVVGGENAISRDVFLAVVAINSHAKRVAGADRYATAASLADLVPGARLGAYLASGEVFPDALSAGPAAVGRSGPVLLTRKDSLPSETRDVLGGLGVVPVWIAGGEGVVGASVPGQITETTYVRDIHRVQGSNRYVTSAAVSADAFAPTDRVYIATGEQYADALAGTPLAASSKSPVLLVRKDRVDAPVCDEIKRLRPTKVTALGGEASVSNAVLDAAAACAAAAAPAPTPTPAPGTPGPGGPSGTCTSNGSDTLDRTTARDALSKMLAVIPAADKARYNPADPIADEIYVLEAEASNLLRAGAPDVCQQAYYIEQVKYMHAQLFEAKINPHVPEQYYDRARAALGAILPIVNPVLNTNYQMP